jgi:uncharacterized protein (DUF58 family)
VKVDFARLNHILVPPTKSERDRYRNGRLGRRLRVLAAAFLRLTREGRALLGAVFFASVFAVDVGRTETHVLLVAASALLCASLLASRAYGLAGVTAEVRAPRRVTVGEEISITLLLRNDGDRARQCLRVDRPLLPWDGSWNGPQPMMAELPPAGMASTVVRARFVSRGEHHIDPLRVAALVPLWLAQGPALRTECPRFVVVPRVARVTSLTSGRQRRHQAGGIASASRTGETTDLLGVRPYRPCDPVRDLHALSWARLGSPMVREYQEEHLARVGVLVDCDTSSSSAEHFEAALSLAAGVIAQMGSGEARVDTLVIDEVAHALPAGSGGLATLDRALDVLAGAQEGEPFSADRVFAHLGPRLETLSTVVLVMLAWDERRAAVASTIRARGIDCVVLVVGDRSSREPDRRTVALGAIAAGEALAL